MTAKESILKHATEHFAKKGYEGVSLREISRDAGVNTASIHYHFSGKEEIYRKVITQYLSVLNQERQENLANIDKALPQTEGVRALIRGYIAPHLKLCAQPDDHAYVRLLARFVVEDDELTSAIYKKQLTEVRHAYFSAIQRYFPSTPTDSLQRVFGSMVMLMIYSPFDGIYKAMSGNEAWPENPDILIEHVVNMTAACFCSLPTNAQST